MKNLLTQIKNEWRSNLFLLVELLLVFAVLWYIVDWVTVTARVYRAPMGFDTEHCYNLSFSTLTSKSALYNPELTVEDNIDNRTFTASSGCGGCLHFTELLPL